MVIYKIVIFLLCFVFLFITGFQTRRYPEFNDYLVDDIFKGQGVKVNLKSHPDARKFRTRLKEAATGGPNFAGHYVVVDWGCGSSCQQFAIINLQTGDVYMDTPATSYGTSFKTYSNLLITDPIDKETFEEFGNENPVWLMTRYYIWNGKQLIQIDSSNSPTN
ncbi:MAG: hypothetical protein HY960_09460 [Ignavibacteriae bacterium]|nr:hypothetical protein [Ignavibacteriota bacterium]